MQNLEFLANLSVTKARFLAILFSVFNAFTWYVVAFETLSRVVNEAGTQTYEMNVTWFLHFGGVAIAALIGARLSNRVISRNNLLLVWMFLGIVSSLLPLAIGASSTSVLAISFLLGTAFGLGLPSCMGYFSDFTVIEKRAWFGGIMYFAIGLGTFLLWTTIIPFTNLSQQLVVLAIWRSFGLMVFLFLRPENAKGKVPKSSYASIVRERGFLLYLIPWVMFCLIDSLTRSLFPAETVRSLSIVGSAITGVMSLVGGLFADRLGRKRVIMVGFIMLGIGYAALGTFPELTSSQYLFTVLGSIAWGIFGAVFLMTLWGDLAENEGAEKFYAIGGLPYLLSGFVQLLVSPYIRGAVSPYATFSFASFFLFIAVFPLWLAQETLPEKTIQNRLLRKYVEDAKKTKKRLGGEK